MIGGDSLFKDIISRGNEKSEKPDEVVKQLINKLEKYLAEKYNPYLIESPTYKVGDPIDTLPEIYLSECLFFLSGSFRLCSRDDLYVLKTSKDISYEKALNNESRRRASLIKFYEERFLKHLKILYTGEGTLEDKNSYVASIDPLSALKSVYSGPRHNLVPHEVLLGSIDDVILASIAFSRDVLYPVELRVKAFRQMKFENENHQSGQINFARVFKRRPKLPLKFTPPEVIGVNGKHDLNTLLAQDHLDADPNYMANHGNKLKYEMYLLGQALEDYPLNALQFFDFLLHQQYGESDGDFLLKRLQECSDELLLKMFSQEASYFKEKDFDPFSLSAKLQLSTGQISPVEENPQEMPEDLPSAITIINGLNNQIAKLVSQIKDLKKRLEQQRLNHEAMINEINAKTAQSNYLACSEPFFLSSQFVQNNITTPEGCLIILSQLKSYYDGKLRDLRNKYGETMVSDAASVGHSKLMKLNTDYQNASEEVKEHLNC